MYNEIKIDTPSAGKTKTYSIAEDDSAKLSLKGEDINGVALGDNGELVIELKNSGRITLINFEKFTQAGNFLYLEDGTLLNFAALMPKPSEEVLNTINENSESVCEIDLKKITTIDDDGELVVRLADGKEIPIDGTFESVAKEITVCKTVLLEPKELLTETTDVATKAANIAPAAGDGAADKALDQIAEELAALDPQAGDGATSNSGFGYGSSFEVTDFNAPDDIGPLGPTQLLYTAPDFDLERFIIASNDTPFIGSDNQLVDETNFMNGVLSVDGRVRVDFGNDGAGKISGTNNFKSSAPIGDLDLKSHGLPVTVTYDNATNSYIGTTINNYYTIKVFTLTLNPLTGQYTYTQFEALDHPDKTDPDDSIFLDFGIIIRDSDGDAARSNIRITVLDDGPQIGNVTNIIDETDIHDYCPASVKGVIPHDFGEDGKGAITANGLFHYVSQMGGHPGQLTAGGHPVDVTTTQWGYVGKVDHKIIFTLDIDPHTGKYTYTQFQGIDHPNAHDPNDVLWLKFYVDIKDFDGDTDTGVIVIDVYDDGPSIQSVARPIDETDLFGKHEISVHGTVNFDYGADEKGGAIMPNGTFMFLTQVGGNPTTITSGGQVVHVTQTNDGYVGKIGHKIIFNLDVNPTTGKFTYTQYDTIDHPDAHNPDDVIWLKFGIKIIDGDGDKDNGFIQIDVRDDGPNAVDDHKTVGRNQQKVTGNILHNDDFGADGPGILLTSGTFYGNFGTLNLKNDGSYTYTRNGNNGGTDSFNYTIKDADGDKDTAKLKITVERIVYDCPLVIDLDGDGIELINKNNNIFYDINEDGLADRTGWVSADDGILVFDKNNDGIINDHSEMFGNDQIGGFEMLGHYDDNQDGVIDVQDVIWSSLKIWQDRNQDGYSQNNEFISFNDLSIQSIDLNVTNIDTVIEGNLVTAVGAFNTATGSSFNAYDAWFQYDDTAQLQNDQTISIKGSFESAQTLLNIQGNGNFRVSEFTDGNILTHNGENINVTFDQNTSIYFGSTTEKIIFNVKIEENGDYQFNLFDSIDQGLHGDSYESITLQFGIVRENNIGDETQEFVSVNIKGMSHQFAEASIDSINIDGLLEGADLIADSIDDFMQDTTVTTPINPENNNVQIFNVTAGLEQLDNHQVEILQ